MYLHRAKQQQHWRWVEDMGPGGPPWYPPLPPKTTPLQLYPLFLFFGPLSKKVNNATATAKCPTFAACQAVGANPPSLEKYKKKCGWGEEGRFGKRTTDCVCGVNGFTFISFVCAWVWVRVCMLVCDESTHFWAWQCFYCLPPTIKATTLVRLSTSAKALSLSRFGRFACCCQAASWMNVPNCEKYPQLNLLGTEKDVEIGLNSLLTIMKINNPKSLIIGWEHY